MVTPKLPFKDDLSDFLGIKKPNSEKPKKVIQKIRSDDQKGVTFNDLNSEIIGID